MTNSPARILVVDDDEALLLAVSHLLRKQGYEVIGAKSGSEALEQTGTHHPDLILLDIKLPDINGVEVLRRIKANPHYDDIFIVHLSAQTGPAETRMLGLELGADDYITQPVENHELIARVKAFLRHKAALDALRESENRYRTLFESNPEPMWIFDKGSYAIVAVNGAAIHQYGFSREEFLKMTMFEVIAPAEHEAFRSSVHGTSYYGNWCHVTKSGKREVETSEQDILWLRKSCRVVLAHDVTERNRIEQEKASQIERLEREFRSLGRLVTEPRGGIREVKDVPLRERDSGARSTLASRYQHLLFEALESRVYKTDHNVSDDLRVLAGELFRLNATARDIIDIHYETLRKVAPVPEIPKAQALIETGRVVLVELLGYLLSAYRQIRPREGING